MKIASSVYVFREKGEPIMIARAGTKVDNRLVDLLMRYQIRWVEALTYAPPSELLDSLIPKATPRPIPPPEKLRGHIDTQAKSILGSKLRKEVISNISKLFSALGKPGEIVNLTTAYQAITGFETALNQVLIAVTQDETGLIHIHDLKSYDEYTYHHSLSVALLSIATGQELGLYGKELQNLGRCALLHDIGKQSIPLSIINKSTKLSDEEFAIIKNHPVKGAESLKEKAIGNQELWNGVMFHHEKYNGSGYPKGLSKDGIPLFARIIAVCDVYDAITSYRSYRKPMTPTEAYELVCSEAENAFEFKIVQAFSKRLILYPPGTIIELSDGRTAVVVENKNMLRPVVKLWGTTQLIDLAGMRQLSLSIKRVVNPKEMEKSGSNANKRSLK